ncbi:uncharacterized protein TNCV_4049611 [Trichonephila clavipes]|nr:uncharacterized protein TNCV_4049611 [Trichonephila clavipes]
MEPRFHVKNTRKICTVERRLPESIGTGHRSNKQTPNAIPAINETGQYTNIEIHHMRETCLKKSKIGGHCCNFTFIVENNDLFFAARSLILLSSSGLLGQHSDCCSYHSIAVINAEDASAFAGPLLISLLLLS